MAVKIPAGPPEKPVKDVDDELADRLHGGKTGASGGSPLQKRAPPPKPVPRKAGHHIDTPGEQAEEQVAEPDAAFLNQAQDVKLKREAKKTNQAEEARKKQKKRDHEGGGQGQGQEAPEPPRPATTAGHLAHDANYFRSRTARKLGFEQTPSVGDFITGLESPAEGEALGVLLPSARARSHPDLPETDVRPPDFLTPLQAMKDIWMRTRGRMSRRTQELLEGPDLEDLLAMTRAIHDDEKLVKKPEARLTSALFSQLKDEPGPLLLGFQDPRLTEVWRLFLEGWEIWVPEGDEEGVELFWEGEAEDDDGEPIALLQSLTLTHGELVLHTRMGGTEDTITFDGAAFFRLKTARKGPVE
jgi:hypothetical protein